MIPGGERSEVPMEIEKNQINKKSLRYRFTAGTIGVLLTLGAVVVSTYAWYVYNTGRHTTKVRMAAGAGINMQISNAYDGVYGSAAVLDSFSGQLNPVSTNRISGGFQKATTAITIKPACSCGAMENPPTSIFSISALRTAMKTIRSHQRFVQVS